MVERLVTIVGCVVRLSIARPPPATWAPAPTQTVATELVNSAGVPYHHRHTIGLITIGRGLADNPHRR